MNLSIPDAAAELVVSETRLRRTLLDSAVPTLVEFRQTRTGVRKTTVLATDAIEQLRAYFAAPCLTAAVPEMPESSKVREEAPRYQAETVEEPQASMLPFVEEATAVLAPSAVSPMQSVPISQFNALLYQHNVLREELSRVTEYLDGCDRLLGEMVRTISTLEERTRQLEPAHSAPRRAGNPLAGALRTVSAGVQNALFARSAKPMLKPAEVYYSNVLAGR